MSGNYRRIIFEEITSKCLLMMQHKLTEHLIILILNRLYFLQTYRVFQLAFFKNFISIQPATSLAQNFSRTHTVYRFDSIIFQNISEFTF